MMDFMLNFEPKKIAKLINYRDKLMLIGSCFTEHIGNALHESKFSLLQNPNGILFDPISVCNSLISYIHNKQYKESDLFHLNEVWNSWQHHSRFSHIDRPEGLRIINESQQQAHNFLKEANWVIITLGTSFSYRLISPLHPVDSGQTGEVTTTNQPVGRVPRGEVTPPLHFVERGQTDEVTPPFHLVEREMGGEVANCHRAPAQWFSKHLLSIQETIEALDGCIHQLFQFNHRLQIIFTISPVRHIRDGVVDNNRSKARLIEAVHHLINKFDKLHYFPSYEIVIDILRDYRFYDIDLVHPNYMATDFVLQKFAASCLDNEARQLMEELKKINIARRHKPFQPTTIAHKQFLQSSAEKTKELQKKYPFLDLKEELDYFTS